MVENIEEKMEKLLREIRMLDDIGDEDADNGDVYLDSTEWNEDEYIYLGSDDIHALIDRRVETLNELEHEMNAIESED